MPWSVQDPPKCALNWTDEEKGKCVEAANAVLRDGGSDEDAIRACIKYAGRTEHPGGEDKQEAKGIELQPVTAEDVSVYQNLFMGSDSLPTELLKFTSAKFCAVGVNKNNDGITEEGIEELADSMRFMPIVDEHIEDRVVGFVLDCKARDRSTALYGSGILFAGRFPSVAEEVRSGEKRISIEAVAREAKCGECNQVFASPKEYCSHLKSKSAVRWLSGLKAKGIATVQHPAWETSFGGENNFVMIASEIDYGCSEKKMVEVSVKEPGWVQELRAWVESKLKPVVAAIDECYCEKCDKTFPHERGVPCSETKCPQCGGLMQPALKGETGVEAADDKKKWSKDVDLKEGSLESLGWDSYEELARSLKEGRVSYKTLISKLVYLQNITKDSATKSKAASIISRLQKAHETEGGILMADFEVKDGETLEEFKDRLGLVAADEVSASEEELKNQFEAEKVELQAGFDAREAELKAEAEKIKVGFERTLELGMGTDEATVLAGLDEEAYALFKRQREEATVQASVEEEEVVVEEETEAGQLQGSVLPTTEVVDDTLALQGLGTFLSEKLAGGK